MCAYFQLGLLAHLHKLKHIVLHMYTCVTHWARLSTAGRIEIAVNFALKPDFVIAQVIRGPGTRYLMCTRKYGHLRGNGPHVHYKFCLNLIIIWLLMTASCINNF